MPMAQALAALGSQAAWVVHGTDNSGSQGLDEVSVSGPTHVAMLAGGRVTEALLTPADFGLPVHAPAALAGGDAPHNAAALAALLEGAGGAYRDCALAGAAAALCVALLAALAHGVAM